LRSRKKKIEKSSVKGRLKNRRLGENGEKGAVKRFDVEESNLKQICVRNHEIAKSRPEERKRTNSYLEHIVGERKGGFKRGARIGPSTSLAQGEMGKNLLRRPAPVRGRELRTRFKPTPL